MCARRVLPAGRCSCPVVAAASAWRSRGERRGTAPTSRSWPRPPSSTPRLDGAIFTAAEGIEAAGWKTLPIAGDIRNEQTVQAAVDRTVEHFGGIDILVNNASAIDLNPGESLAMKRYGLMQDINARDTFLLSHSGRAPTSLPPCSATSAARTSTHRSRRPEHMADAAYAIPVGTAAASPATSASMIAVLAEDGVTELRLRSIEADVHPLTDVFVEDRA